MKKKLLLVLQRAMIIGGACLIIYSLYAPDKHMVVDFPMVNKFMTNGGIVNGQEVLFPFIVNLKTSKIVYERPTLSVFQKGSWEKLDHVENLITVKSGDTHSLMDWSIRVDTVFTSSIRYKGRVVTKEVPEGVPAAFVHVTDKHTGELKSGWVRCASIQDPAVNLDLSDSLTLVLTQSSPLSYWADILIMRDRLPEEVDPNTMFLDKVPFVRLDSFILEAGATRSIMDGWKLQLLGYENTHNNQPDKIMMRATKGAIDWYRYAGFSLLLLGAVWVMAEHRRLAEA